MLEWNLTLTEKFQPKSDIRLFHVYEKLNKLLKIGQKKPPEDGLILKSKLSSLCHDGLDLKLFTESF